MTDLTVGLVTDPASPTDVARRLGDLDSPEDATDGATWEVDLRSEPFTTDCEDLETAMSRLHDRAETRGWDAVVGLTELPLHGPDGHYLAAETDTDRRITLISLPALGGPGMLGRCRRVARSSIEHMVDPDTEGTRPLSLSRRSERWRLLLGMVLANRPWLLVPGLKSALVAALATGAVATINSTVWLLATSLSPWRLAVAMVASLALVVVWLLVDGELWDRPDEDSPRARERSRLYNLSTVMTLGTGVLICYVVLFAVNLVWALFVLDPAVMGSYLRTPFGHGDLFLLAWFVASAATVGGGLGSGLESDEAIRAAAYSRREEERRRRLADGRSSGRTDD